MHRRSEQQRSKGRHILQQLIGAGLPRDDPSKLVDAFHNHALRQLLDDSLKRSVGWHRQSAPLEELPTGEPAGLARMRSGAQGQHFSEVAAARDGASDKITAQCLSRAARIMDGIPCEHVTKAVIQLSDILWDHQGSHLLEHLHVESTCRLLAQDMIHCYWKRCPSEWIESIDSLKEDCRAQRFAARRGESCEVSAALGGEDRARMLRSRVHFNTKALFDSSFRKSESLGRRALSAFEGQMKELHDLVGDGLENSDEENLPPIETVRSPKLRGRARKRAKASRQKKLTRKQRRLKRRVSHDTRALLSAALIAPAPPLIRDLELDSHHQSQLTDQRSSFDAAFRD